MYKKVTHTITEEHFGHPMASEIKKVIDKTITPPKPKMEPTPANKFRNEVEQYFVGYNIKLNNIFKAIEQNNETELVAAEKIFFDEVDMLGNKFKTYYGIEFGERFNQYMRTLMLLFISIAKNLKNKLDIRDWRQRVDTVRFELSTLLNTYNNGWRQFDMQALLGQVFAEVIQHAQDVIQKSSNADVSFDKLGNLLSVFNTQISNGVIQQHPDKFIT
jgi:hypothetical protein